MHSKDSKVRGSSVWGISTLFWTVPSILTSDTNHNPNPDLNPDPNPDLEGQP